MHPISLVINNAHLRVICHYSRFICGFPVQFVVSVPQQTGRAWKAQRKCPNVSIFVFCRNHKDFGERLNIAK
jgi:hypothetical protein